VEAVSKTGKAIKDVQAAELQRIKEVPGDGEPVAGCVHLSFRQIYIAVAHVLGSVELDLLVAHNLARYLDLAVLDNEPAFHLCVEVVHNADTGIGHGIGVVIDVHLLNIRLLALQIEFVHMVLLRLYHVDRTVVDCCESAVPVHFCYDFVVSCIGGVNHHNVFRIDRSQAHLVSRVALCRPVPALVYPVDHSFFLQIGEQLHKIFLAKFFTFFKGKLKCRTLDVVE